MLLKRDLERRSREMGSRSVEEVMGYWRGEGEVGAAGSSLMFFTPFKSVESHFPKPSRGLHFRLLK